MPHDQMQRAGAARQSLSAEASSQRVVLYAGIGPELVQYDVDAGSATLVRRGSVTLPACVQYAWQHASKRYLYVVSSNRGPDGGPAAASGPAGDLHHLSAFRIDPVSGALQPHGQPVALSRRPIHMTTDVPSEHALIAYYSMTHSPIHVTTDGSSERAASAYRNPSDLTVHRINPDGTVGEEVKQPGVLDVGVVAHQIRVAPSNTMAILVTRGNDAAHGKPEEPGALKVFKYRNGVLSDAVSIAPGGGYGFGPRHLDFHPTRPWVYVSLERQHKMCLFALDGDRLSSEPLFSKDTLAEPDNVRPHQMASTVHVHPNGRFVYGAERVLDADAMNVFGEGENTIVAYAIDERSGEPTLIQRVDTRGMHPRTFSVDPSGAMLIAANKSPLVATDGKTVHIPANLSVFRIGADGRLAYVCKYDVDVGDASMFWTGLAVLET